jgi:arsenate reductase
MATGDEPTGVLFLCTHNSARSILAEALLNKLGAGLYLAYSAGSTPRGVANPLALKTLAGVGHDISGLRSKSWDEFAGSGAPRIDFIFTLCDEAAAETCPLWRGHPASGHWGMPDPSRVDGGEAAKLAAFEQAYARLEAAIGRFVAVARECATAEDFEVRIPAVSAEIRAMVSAPYSTGA